MECDENNNIEEELIESDIKEELNESESTENLLEIDQANEMKRIDYVLTYFEKDDDSEHQHERELYLQNLCMNGLKLRVKRESIKNGDFLIFVLIECPIEMFFDVAERIKLKMPIAENDLYEDELFSVWSKLECFSLPKDIKMKKKRNFFTIPYTTNLHQKFMEFFDDKDEYSIIAEKDYMMITYEILSRTTFSRELCEPAIFSDIESDTQVGIELLLARNIFDSAYPLHQKFGFIDNEIGSKKTDRQILWEYWIKPWNVLIFQPLHIIRLYFGEKLAFYFAWLGFYTSWLIPPSIAGVLTVLYGIINVGSDIPTKEVCNTFNRTDDILMCPLCNLYNCKTWYLSDSCTYSKITYLVDNPATVYFSLFMAIWTVLFIEFWKREQSKLQFEWDTFKYGKKNEMIRPDYEIKVCQSQRNPITGENEPYVPLTEKIKRYSFSATVMCLMVCLVLGCVLGVIVYRVCLLVVLSNSESLRKVAGPIVSITAALLNLVLILILTQFYSWLALKLTDMEYHRTDSNYEDSLTIKMYLFQFINFYASIFYIAFIKGRMMFYSYTEPCEQSGCLTELTIQLAIIMGGQIFYNAIEILDPVVRTYFARKQTDKTSDGLKVNKEYFKGDDSESQWKQDFSLLSWTNWTLFDEYLDIVIQYGFISMFVVAFPLGPLLAFCNNILEIRVDAFKSLALMRRPMPKRAKDIGVWLPIINIISKIGIITNGAIIAFTSEFIPRLVYKYRNNDLEGYVDSTLSVRVTNNITNKHLRDFYIKQNITECRFRDFTEEYQYSSVDYEVLIARLAFLVLFEHLVFFLVAVMHTCIKNVPKHIQNQIDREEIITQKAIWQSKPVNLTKVEKCKESTNTFLKVFHNIAPILKPADFDDKSEEVKLLI